MPLVWALLSSLQSPASYLIFNLWPPPDPDRDLPSSLQSPASYLTFNLWPPTRP